jgi:hypothetical protein
VAVLADHLCHRVDHRLRQALGPLGAEHLGRAVGAQRLAQLVAQVLAAEHQRVALAADLLRAGVALGHRPERVLVELAFVVKDVGEDVGHI